MTRDEPNVLTGEQAEILDPQASRLFAAENEFEMENYEYFEAELEYLTPDQVPGFARDALEKAGLYAGELPKFRFDIPHDSRFSAAHETRTGDIRLHERLLCPRVILHELAHWLCGGLEFHGPAFCGKYVQLLRASLGDEFADCFRCYLDRFGVETHA